MILRKASYDPAYSILKIKFNKYNNLQMNCQQYQY